MTVDQMLSSRSALTEFLEALADCFIDGDTFRAKGIAAYLQNGGTIEHAHASAANESRRITKLYGRTSDALALEEIERIAI